MRLISLYDTTNPLCRPTTVKVEQAQPIHLNSVEPAHSTDATNKTTQAATESRLDTKLMFLLACYSFRPDDMAAALSGFEPPAFVGEGPVRL